MSDPAYAANTRTATSAAPQTHVSFSFTAVQSRALAVGGRSLLKTRVWSHLDKDARSEAVLLLKQHQHQMLRLHDLMVVLLRHLRRAQDGLPRLLRELPLRDLSHKVCSLSRTPPDCLLNL